MKRNCYIEMNEYFQSMKLKIKEKSDFLKIFEKYRIYLEKLIRQEPCDVIVFCQLMSSYFSLGEKDEDEIIQEFENFLKENKNVMDNAELSRIYTNLAFFYKEADFENKEENILKSIHYLKLAIQIQDKSPKACDLLGIIFYEKKDYENAKIYFKQAYESSKKLNYQYNYAITLINIKDIKKAKEILENMLIEDEENAKILYAMSICHIYDRQLKQALEIADRLISIKDDEDLQISQIADIYYLCECYEKHNMIYDESKIDYYNDELFLSPYFYSLKVQGKFKDLDEKFKLVLKEKDNLIQEEKLFQTDEYYTKEDAESRISSLNDEKYKISLLYKKILSSNYKPEITPFLEPMIKCHLIDCIEHQEEILTIF